MSSSSPILRTVSIAASTASKQHLNNHLHLPLPRQVIFLASQHTLDRFQFRFPQMTCGAHWHILVGSNIGA